MIYTNTFIRFSEFFHPTRLYAHTRLFGRGEYGDFFLFGVHPKLAHSVRVKVNYSKYIIEVAISNFRGQMLAV